MGAVTNLEDKKRKCCYCGLVTEDQHPLYTCPRIVGVTMDGESTTVELMSGKEWEDYVKEYNGR